MFGQLFSTIRRCRFAVLLFILAAQAWGNAADVNDIAEQAANGDMDAQFTLGLAYDFGNGVAQDLTAAAIWYQKAADQGHAQAQNNLGSLYQHGQGVPQDYQLAARWYEAAAKQGLPDAANSLAYLYDLGLGVQEDDAKAVSLYTTAAEGGSVRAMVNLGVMYADGTGVPADNVQAYMWLDLARFYTQQSKDMDLKWHVRRVLDEYKARMTRKEIKAGKKMAKAWDKANRS
jgi:TPR repeat protein